MKRANCAPHPRHVIHFALAAEIALAWILFERGDILLQPARAIVLGGTLGIVVNTIWGLVSEFGEQWRNEKLIAKPGS